jgi:hypothetical protein
MPGGNAGALKGNVGEESLMGFADDKPKLIPRLRMREKPRGQLPGCERTLPETCGVLRVVVGQGAVVRPFPPEARSTARQ